MAKKKKLNGFRKQAKASWLAYLSRGKKTIKMKKEKQYSHFGTGNN